MAELLRVRRRAVALLRWARGLRCPRLSPLQCSWSCRGSCSNGSSACGWLVMPKRPGSSWSLQATHLGAALPRDWPLSPSPPHRFSRSRALVGLCLPTNLLPLQQPFKMRSTLLRPLLPRYNLCSPVSRSFSLPQLASSSNTFRASRFFSATTAIMGNKV